MTLLRNAAYHKQLHGVSISRGGPQITHLLFANDSSLFGNASIFECHTIKEILHVYEVATGQKINCDKTSIFFSTNTPRSLRENIRHFLNAIANEPLEKYLGLLSQVGKEILIKSVAQAILVYAMNCFLLPMGFCEDINSMMGQFW